MPDLSNNDLEYAAREMVKSKTLKEDIKFQNIELIKEKTTKLSIDGMSFLVEKYKIQSKTRLKTWTTCNSPNDCPKKGSFSFYFDWTNKNRYICSKHKNCNLNTLSKILPIKSIKSKPMRTIRETITSSELWLCNNFPLPLRNIFPFFDIIAFTNPVIAKFNEFLKVAQLINSAVFPLRLTFPISQTASMQVQFSDISLMYFFVY
jgi:hypothetical protein